MCFQTPPKAVSVKVKPADSSVEINFDVIVLEISHDRVQVRLERIDDTQGWDWMLLTVEWIVYTDDVGSDWQKYNGYAYKALQGVTTYEKAREACRSEGAWLPVFGPMEIAANGGNNYNDIFGDRHWIGLKRENGNGKFFWENWTKLSLDSYWKPGEPHQNKFCVISHTGNKWKTQDCDQTSSVVCERIAPVHDDGGP
uniref:C-type lectin domain-containing protein n=2 Tax=Ciona intestinalis TaxID=7719 RepID=H2XSC4_CIOIN